MPKCDLSGLSFYYQLVPFDMSYAVLSSTSSCKFAQLFNGLTMCVSFSVR